MCDVPPGNSDDASENGPTNNAMADTMDTASQIAQLNRHLRHVDAPALYRPIELDGIRNDRLSIAYAISSCLCEKRLGTRPKPNHVKVPGSVSGEMRVWRYLLPNR